MDNAKSESKAKPDAKAQLTCVSEHFKEGFNAAI